jgi:soluble lytic murein transglycosylase
MTPRTAALVLSLASALLAPAAVTAQGGDLAIVEARDSASRKDKARLATLKAATAQHPLASWVDYWELGNRLAEVQAPEVEAFYARRSGTYVEDRLRNDWLLELGRRRDWVNFVRDFPRFKMNDDREVTCYALLTRHIAGEDVRVAARSAWFAQRDLDDGCHLLATTLYEARQFSADDAWQEARLSIEFNKPRAARAAGQLVHASVGQAVGELLDNPARLLASRPAHGELALLALMRLATSDPEAAAAQLDGTWARRLSPAQVTQAWAAIGKQAAQKHQPAALEQYKRAWRGVPTGGAPGWSDDTLAWSVRAALRATGADGERWSIVLRSIDAMSAAQQRDPAWVYWKARALQARAKPGIEGDADRATAQLLLGTIAGQLHFYGKLATEDLGGAVLMPPAPQPLTDAEHGAARATPGFARALQLIALGLRDEGVREWNFTLRGLADRDLLAAAQLACEREVWDRCINTSDRTRGEIDMAQRFPMPFRAEVLAKARATGLDPAYVYGLIRQESRFVMDARSHVGASGLMQIMPATARWTARKIGVPDYKPEAIAERDMNLRLGTGYLKLVLDDFDGSQAMAAAAYNAGPSRPRRWREGGVIEPAAWAETIPFNETRDYVKKVLSNAVYYAALLGQHPLSLKSRLGAPIGPRDSNAPAVDAALP